MGKLFHSFVAPDFKLVAKIGLSVAGASFVGLLIVLLVISDGNADGYGQIIGSVGLVKEALAPAMLVFGLAIVSFAGITTWLFALYASFRVAGPLFRIASDIERQIESGTAKLIPIRTTDKLQSEWRGFEESVAILQGQKTDLLQAVNRVERVIDGSHSPQHADELKVAASQLYELAHRVKF
jgi:hypothetical protein